MSRPAQGLAEYLAVLAVLTALAAGAVLLLRDPIRAAFGDAPGHPVRPARAAAPAPR